MSQEDMMPDLKHTHEGDNACLACSVRRIRYAIGFAPDADQDIAGCLTRITAALAERETAPAVLGRAYAEGVMAATSERNKLAAFRACSVKQQTCKHLTEQQSHEAECFICSTLDCPTGCELHYHHDGCADCGQQESSLGESTQKEGES